MEDKVGQSGYEAVYVCVCGYTFHFVDSNSKVYSVLLARKTFTLARKTLTFARKTLTFTRKNIVHMGDIKNLLCLTIEYNVHVAIIVAVAFTLIIAATTKNSPTKLEEPIMERSRAKGKMALGRRDYGSSDVITVAQQETARE
jgi:hypothetical protein